MVLPNLLFQKLNQESRPFFLDWVKEDQEERKEGQNKQSSEFPVVLLFYCKDCLKMNTLGMKSFKDRGNKICQHCSFDNGLTN